MWVLLLSRRSDPPGTSVARRELESGKLKVGRRAETNDWVIDDPDSWVSRDHLVVEARGIDLFVTDVSNNGTALNEPSAQLPSKQPIQVRVGDRLLLNQYIITVASPLGGIGARPSSELIPPKPVVAALDPDDPFRAAGNWGSREGLLGAAPSPDPGWRGAAGRPIETGGQPPPPFDWDQVPAATGSIGRVDDGLGGGPLQPHSSAIAGSPFDDDPVGGFGGFGVIDPLDPGGRYGPAPSLSSRPMPIDAGPLSGAYTPSLLSPTAPTSSSFAIPSDWANLDAAPEPPLGPAPAMPPIAPRAIEERAPVSAAPPIPTPEPGADWLAFCDAAELEPAELAPPGPQTWRMLGVFYRQVVLGLSELIRDRAEFKREFRIEATQLAQGRNNPLKHLRAIEAARLMLRPPTPGFVDPEQATRESFEDVKRHQMAMLAGVQHALRMVLDELSPAAVDAQVARLDAGRRKGLLARGSDPYTTYKAMYETLRRESSSNTSGKLSESFRQGYEAFLRNF